MTATGWSFSIDRGGTFTDIVAQGPDGRRVVRKLLSDNPERYADAAVAGIAAILEDAGGGAIDAVKMGTTVATNALLERKASRSRWRSPPGWATPCASARRPGPTSSRAGSFCRSRFMGR